MIDNYPEVSEGSTLALKTIAMPADTNPYGHIFGGWIMAQMDIASGMYAAHQVSSRIATVSVDAMTFYKPVHVGDQVNCFCRVEKLGNTSITIGVEVWVRRHQSSIREKVTEGRFVFVALDKEGNPQNITLIESC